MTTQDPELSAALGWPGGISDPVLDRKTLLQMVAALRLASQQALEALDGLYLPGELERVNAAITALRAALAQQAEPLNLRDPAVQKRLATQWGYVPAAQAEPDLSRCPQCNGPADNGFDRSIPPSPYLCTKCMAEPVEPVEPVAYTTGHCENHKQKGGCQLHNLQCGWPDCDRKPTTAPPQRAEPVAGRAFLERILAAMEGVIDVADRKTDEFDALRSCVIDLTLMLHTTPPQRKPLTEEEILAAVGWERAAMYMKLTPNFPVDEAKKETLTNARAVEKASWEKNHG